MNKGIINNEIGATLVETIVVIAIMIVLSLLFIVNFPRINSTLSLSRSGYAMAQNIKIVQNMALSATDINDGGDNIINANGYGVYVDSINQPNRYILYANVDSDPLYNKNFNVYCAKEINPQVDCIISVNMVGQNNSNLQIKRIGGLSSPEASVNFALPDGRVFIGSALQESSLLEIVLGFKNNPSLEQVVVVNAIGLIEVK